MRTLIIPDIHHNIPWMQNILDAADLSSYGPGDEIVFLGDYFDAWKPEVNAKHVIQAINAVRTVVRMNGAKLTLLVGNHDLQYLYELQVGKGEARAWNPHKCSGYSASRADDIRRYAVDYPWVNRLLPFCTSQGFLLSHAGIDSRVFAPYRPGVVLHSVEWEREADAGALGKMFAEATSQLRDLQRVRDSPFWYVGRSRGGMDPYSGIVWQDWSEFRDELPWPQVVGHTGRGVKEQKGRSFCIDNNQTSYAVITDGLLTHHTA